MGENEEIAEAIADALTAVSPVDELQVSATRRASPAVVCLDVFPADPSQEDLAFGPRSRTSFWTVRARVPTADSDGQQRILLGLMDRFGDTSVREALLDDRTLGGVVDELHLDGPSGYRLYDDLGAGGPLLLGVEWSLRIFHLEIVET